MKYLTIIMLIFAMGITAHAQNNFFGMSYNVAFPTGNTADYIEGTQWRGMGMEGRWFLSRNTSMGFAWDWNVLHDVVSGTSEISNGAVTGTQVRTINAMPFLLTGHYYLQGASWMKGFAGLGVGTYFTKRNMNLGVFTAEESEWMFGLAPEIGVMIPFDMGFFLSLKFRYNYAFEAGDIPAQSFYGISIGFASLSLY